MSESLVERCRTLLNTSEINVMVQPAVLRAFLNDVLAVLEEYARGIAFIREWQEAQKNVKLSTDAKERRPLVERVRAFLARYKSNVTFHMPDARELVPFLEDVLAVLEDYERYYSTKQALAGDGELEGEREERASQERRTLALAQMAAVIYAAFEGPDKAKAVEQAREILRACEGDVS